MIAAPRQWLKTGADQRKQQQHHRRAEFFALPNPFIYSANTLSVLGERRRLFC
jgi:hypothetical protein